MDRTPPPRRRWMQHPDAPSMTPLYDHFAARYDAACAKLDAPVLKAQLLAAPGRIGVDTSRWQGRPDWAKVAAAGYSYAYIKASQGGVAAYSGLDAQYQGAFNAGLDVGLYHYADPRTAPEANADAFAAQLLRLDAVRGHLRPALDLEEGAGDLSGFAQRFIQRLRARTGVQRVLVYSGAAFFRDHIGERWMDASVGLWIAHYGRPPGHPMYLTDRVLIHQYSSTGGVPGIAGHVDLNFSIAPRSALLTNGPDDDEDDMPASPLVLPAGNGMRQIIPVPPFNDTALLYVSTGWAPAAIRAMYFVRDAGPGLSPAQEGWGGTGSFTLNPDDRPSWALPAGCTQISLEYDAPYPLATLIVYKPAPL